MKPDAPPPPRADLLSLGVLKRSLAWNGLGSVLPLAAALLALPWLIEGLGTERFGLLTLAWALLGYASLFDLGLGRALTLGVAERLGRGDESQLPSLVWTALAWLLGLGLVAALLLWAGARPLVAAMGTPQALQDEAVAAFRVLAFGLPLVFASSALSGVLMALQRFDVLTLVRLPLALVTTLGPLWLLGWSQSLVAISVLMLVARAISLLALGWGLARTGALGQRLMAPCRPSRPLARELLGQGGWMTVTNVVGPLLTYLDRFFVGALLGAAAVAWYVTPYEVLSRFNLIPGVLLGVLFPALATARGRDPARLLLLMAEAARVLRLALFALCLAMFVLADVLLSAWINPAFAEQAAPVARWLAVGVWVNVLAHTPFTFLQGAGRADLIAKAHLAETLPYLALLVWWTQSFGIAGTAAAWCARVLVDTLLILWLAAGEHAPLAQPMRAEALWLAAGLAAFAAVALALPTLLQPWLPRAVLVAAVALAVAWALAPAVWRLLRRERAVAAAPAAVTAPAEKAE